MTFIVKDRPAACLDVHDRSIGPYQTIDKIAKRLAQLMRRDMSRPFLSLFLEVAAEFPTCLSDVGLGLDAGYFKVLGSAHEPMVRSGLPQPVRSGLGKIAEALFAVAQFVLHALALRIFDAQRLVALREF